MWKGGMHVMSPNTEVAPGTPPTVSSVCHRSLRCVTAVYTVPDTSQEIITCPKHENVWSVFLQLACQHTFLATASPPPHNPLRQHYVTLLGTGNPLADDSVLNSFQTLMRLYYH